jgi:DNA recombination protein RmuC
MENILLVVALCIMAISLILNLSILRKMSKSSTDNLIATQKQNIDSLSQKMEFLVSSIQNSIKMYGDSQTDLLKISTDQLSSNIKNMIDANNRQLLAISNQMAQLTTNTSQQMKELVATTNSNLEQLRQSNEKKLDDMRTVVDEKLNATLQDRLDKSFALVSKQLQEVTRGLGEMQSLATGVGDLKRVITNVKTRGTFGEVQLGNLLEQMLAPAQFQSQVNTNPDNSDRVDFVVHLPGKDDKDLLLPIDAKFPIEDYIRLQDAYDTANQETIEKCKKALETQIKTEAKKICTKYICVPQTTDFAIMYLATEGLYSEVIKNTTLVEKLQQENHILICGPTTLSALLNSLQMGFKTLAIEKRSAEIWNMLSVFKKEFATYVELLEKTQKKLTEANDTIQDASKKSQKISKQLSKVEDLGSDDIKHIQQ